jgi:hypothetical protein
MNLIRDTLNTNQIKPIILRRQHIRADLNDDGFAGLKDFLSHKVLHGSLDGGLKSCTRFKVAGDHANYGTYTAQYSSHGKRPAAFVSRSEIITRMVSKPVNSMTAPE